MKIVFVEVPSPWLVRQNAQVPLGLLYLATILRNAGHGVRVARPTVEQFPALAMYDIVCLSGTTLEYPMVEQCARAVQAEGGASVWYGGPHATAMAPELIENKLFDSIGIGESESHIVQMVEDYERGNLQASYSSPPCDLDSIPFPDRTLIEGTHGGDIFAFGENYVGGGNENIITSRGCAWGCAFCASQCMFPKVRLRSAENVLSEIENIIETTGCRQLRFADDEMVANVKRLTKICAGLKEMNCAWRCSARADKLKVETCEMMHDAGCKEVSVGVESGDQRVLDLLGKRTTVEKIVEGCGNAEKAGLKVRALFMIGTPGEYTDTPELNKALIARAAFYSVTLSTYVPLPGSPIWHHPEKFGCEIIPLDFAQYNKDFWIAKDGERLQRDTCVTIRTDTLTPGEQVDNIDRMKRYMLESGKCNVG